MAESRRFLVVLWNGGGNVPPALALIRRLLARGHHVRVLGPRSLAQRMAPVGAEFEPYESVPEWDPARGRALEDQADAFIELLRGECVADDVLAALERDPVDVALIDCMLGAALCAAELRRTVVRPRPAVGVGAPMGSRQ